MQSHLPSQSVRQDQFDQLPDAHILAILSMVQDVHSLGRCSAVSKRLRSLVPLVGDLHLKIDGAIAIDEPQTRRPPLSRILSAVTKPMRSHITTGAKRSPIRRYSPAQILKNFTQVRHLTIELPSRNLKEGLFIRWSEHKDSFALVGKLMPASSLRHDSTEEVLIRRLDWIISFFTTEYRRTSFVGPMIRELATLRSLVLTYTGGEGRVVFDEEHLRELREKPAADLDSAQGPTKMVEVRYAPYLELVGGIGLHGATLLTVNPLAQKSSFSSVAEAFDGPIKAAIQTLLEQKAYQLDYI